MDNIIKLKNNKLNVISIGTHAVNPHERFSDAITCLSQALEAFDGAAGVNAVLSNLLYEKTAELVHFAERVEIDAFGGEFRVVHK